MHCHRFGSAIQVLLCESDWWKLDSVETTPNDKSFTLSGTRQASRRKVVHYKHPLQLVDCDSYQENVLNKKEVLLSIGGIWLWFLDNWQPKPSP